MRRIRGAQEGAGRPAPHAGLSVPGAHRLIRRRTRSRGGARTASRRKSRSAGLVPHALEASSGPLQTSWEAAPQPSPTSRLGAKVLLVAGTVTESRSGRVGAPAPCCSVEGRRDGGAGYLALWELRWRKGCKFGSFERKFSEQGRLGRAGPWKRHLTFRLSRPGRGRRDHGQEVRMFGSVWFCLQRAWNPSIDGQGTPAFASSE